MNNMSRTNKLSSKHKRMDTSEQEKQLDQSTGKITNIFSSQPSANQFKQEKGPRYDQNGELIKYSLVGKADWYNKLQYQGKKPYFEEGTTKHGQARQADEKSVYRTTFDVKSINWKNNGSDKKQLNKMKEQIRTKNQLLDEIDSIRQRVLSNKEKDQDQINGLPDFIKIHFLKQKALFEKHQENQESWDNFVLQSSTKLERDPFYSQLLRAEQYRSKLEAAQTFEVLKSESERYGTRVWYNTLRQQDGKDVGKKFLKLKDRDVLIENKSEIPLILNQDLPEAFKSAFLSGTKDTIEYIRKPQNLNLYNITLNNTMSSKQSVNQAQNSLSLPFKSFSSDKYLRERMNAFSKNFAQQNIISYDRLNELDQLMIQGKSQFEVESDLVIKDKRDGMAIYKKYINKTGPDLDDQRPPPDEIIAIDYSRQNKMRLPMIQKDGRRGKLRKQETLRSSQSHLSGMNLSNSDAE